MISDFPEVSEHFETYGLFPIPKVIRGTYEGKHYPKSYSAEQRRLIYEYLMKARQKYDLVYNGMSEPPTINMFSDYLFLNGIKDYRGGLCSAGHRFVTIMPEGTVTSCEPSAVLGNILCNSVRLLNAPRHCNTSYCPYFCEKYSVEPDSYSSYLKVRMLKVYYLIRGDFCMKMAKTGAAKLKKPFSKNKIEK